ncbi:type VI secretion system baseplate subunit TssG [Klebsiella pneumoniae]|nr:type VI secretion system baseplate subunit TssG [Klebsiella pneumoniae]
MKPIRFRPHPGMGFPVGEIRAMDDPEPPRPPAVHVTFMGLYGVESPLPKFTIAMALRNGGKASRPPRISSISLTIG